MNDEFKPTTAGDIQEAVTKPVTNPATGRSFIIRQVSPFDFISEGFLPIGDLLRDMQGKSEEDVLKYIQTAINEKPTEDMAEFYKVVVSKGVQSLNILLTGEADSTKNEILVEHVPIEDLNFLMNEIVDFSGINLAAWGVSPASFREGQRPVGVQDGEEVRETPDGDS